MENVLSLQDNKIEQDRFTSNLATTVALISWAMLFTTLFMGYAIYRFQAEVWPPLGVEKLSLATSIPSTIIVFLSSITFIMAQRAYQRKKLRSFKYFLGVTLMLGVLFLAAQFNLWKQLKLSGLYVSSGIFASIIHGFTWIHAGHMVLGLAFLLYLSPLAFKSACFERFDHRINNIGKFWHFLGIIWLLMFLLLFVL
jgi:cytochrome c oxidase subunit 3